MLRRLWLLWDIGWHAWTVSVVGFGREHSAILKGVLIEALLCAREERLLAKVLWAVLGLLIARSVQEPELAVHLEHGRVVCGIAVPKRLEHLRSNWNA